MNKYEKAILKIKKMNCNITKDWNCEICTHQKVCAYYLPCKTLQKLVDKETPKEPYISESAVLDDCKRALCPVCDNFTYYYRLKPEPTYCTYCGQRFRGDE